MLRQDVNGFFFFFFPLRRKGLLDHTVNNEMFALAMLTLYKNLLIAHMKGPLSALTGVRIKYVKFRENVRAFHKDKENYFSSYKWP